MPKALKLYITGLVGTSAIALVATSLFFVGRAGLPLGIRAEISVTGQPTQFGVLAGLAFWTVITLFASALPVRMPRGTLVSVSIAPIVAAMVLGGPVAAGLVAALGTTEVREVRGTVPWYGSTKAATYGADGWSNFFNAALLWEGPIAIAAGTPWRVRHRVVVHDGRWSPARVAQAHAAHHSPSEGARA